MKKLILDSIGELHPHPRFPEEWLTSEAVSIPFFDGKELKFTLDGYSDDDEAFLIEADIAISNFLTKNAADREAISHLVFQNYRDFVEAVGDEDELPEIEVKENVWAFVYPQIIYVTRRHRRDKDIYLLIHCECEWEVEHGLQIVFRQGQKVTRVSDIDGHATEADAYDKPDEDDVLLSKF